LKFNDNLPLNFLDILTDLTYQYKKCKVGFALDLSDSNLFFKDGNYMRGLSIEEWEKKFWLKKIDNPQYELYDTVLDTTFCIVNKTFLIKRMNMMQ